MWYTIKVIWLTCFGFVSLAYTYFGGTSTNAVGFATDKQMLFQTPGSCNMEDIVFLHHYIMMFIVMIFIFVCFMTYFSYSNFKVNNFYYLSKGGVIIPALDNKKRNISYETNKIKHHSLLEFIWTLVPSIILLLIAGPSFMLLYSVEESINPELIVKVIAHQWYWVYEIVKR